MDQVPERRRKRPRKEEEEEDPVETKVTDTETLSLRPFVWQGLVILFVSCALCQTGIGSTEYLEDLDRTPEGRARCWEFRAILVVLNLFALVSDLVFLTTVIRRALLPSFTDAYCFSLVVLILISAYVAVIIGGSQTCVLPSSRLEGMGAYGILCLCLGRLFLYAGIVDQVEDRRRLNTHIE